MNKKCKYCKKSYQGQGRMYCSRSCSALDRPVSYYGFKHWNWHGGQVKKVCRNCGKDFFVDPYRKDVAVICSNKCRVPPLERRKRISETLLKLYKTEKGKRLKKKLSNFRLNQQHNVSIFKKGELHPNFKGKKSTRFIENYQEIHRWIRKTFGNESICENKNCKNANPKRFVWALIHGKKYEMKRENFWRLCNKCHYKYDYGFRDDNN